MPQWITNKKIEINPEKIGKNRQTFDCTLCNDKNFDRVGYIDHVKKRHPKARGVCAICKCQPWGDPNYKTHIYGHINIRHKFDYDTVVDYNDDDRKCETTYEVILPKVFNLNLIMRKQWSKPSLYIFLHSNLSGLLKMLMS